jgi:CDP-diacylglycerol---glycerol-3-phosphate 3-phosphatidyltransferase
MNIPNFLTILRVALTPLGAYALFNNGGADHTWMIIAWCTFFIIGLTDFLDGKIARAKNQITEFGKLLDPIADKVSIGTAMISLSILHRLPWWVTIAILAREIGVTVLRFAVLKDGVIPASKGGKLKALMQGFGVGWFILPLPHWLFLPRDLFMGIAIALTWTTGYEYFKAVLKK